MLTSLIDRLSQYRIFALTGCFLSVAYLNIYDHNIPAELGIGRLLWSVHDTRSSPIPTQPGYTIEVMFRDPLMMYIKDFLREDEINHLLALSKHAFRPSKVADAKKGTYASELRTSTSFFLPQSDPVVGKIKERAESFAGFLPHDGVEQLQLVHYNASQSIAYHYDWFDEPMASSTGGKYNRYASFFVYLDAECTGGETFFPHLRMPDRLAVPEPGESSYLRTTEEEDRLMVVPKRGNGVFWLNFGEDGVGDERVLHAGLPVESGSKVGMNIWVKKTVG